MTRGYNKYFIENDLIELAGEDAIKRLGRKYNDIFLDLDYIENEADNTNNPHFEQYREALDFIWQGEFIPEKAQIKLPTKGMVCLDKEKYKKEEEERQITHITRKKGLKSKLKRQQIPVEMPEFLKYGPEVFDSAIIDVDYNLGNPKEIKSLDDLNLNETQIEDIPNNQIIRVNGGIFYRVKHDLIQINRHDRYSIDENSQGFLERIEPRNFNCNGEIVGFKPRNLVQSLGGILLMDKDIEVYFIVGGSGSGKTVISYATAISQILINSKENNRRKGLEGIILFKSNDIIGGKNREQGFLPGTAFEKVKPFMKSYMDAHRLLGLNKGKGSIMFSELLADPLDATDEFGKRKQNTLFGYRLPSENKAIEIEHLQYARGRTFENQVIFIDEAQNYSPYEMKQLIERIGTGSKIFIVGDTEQIDNPKLSKDFNGLTYTANLFLKNHPRMSMIKFDENYRSQSAEISRSKKAPQL